MSIELVAQVRGNRIPLPASSPDSTLMQVLSSALDTSTAFASLRYLSTVIPRSQWDTTRLSDLSLQSGDRALFVLEESMEDTAASTSAALQEAVAGILKKNFDEDSKACIVTLIKILDNVLQKPNNPKVRSIRLANPVIEQKVVSRGGVNYLLACGFVRQSTAPALLSDQGDPCLVLTQENESTSHLVLARRLLMQTAIQELHMEADDLPKYKPPPPPPSAASTNSTTASNPSSFNPYQRHRFNATGQPQQETYVSTTETKLRQLQSHQDRLESKLQHNAVLDRQVVAFRPQESVTTATSTVSNTGGPSDGALLAQRMQRLEQERKEREEGGFTTKAMRDLQRLKKQKVYSHTKLRIQFPDGTALEAKFLPKETVQVVKSLVQDCLISRLDFDLYVTPPRRKLDVERTLQEEQLVPAAKCFVSWKGGVPTGMDFIKAELFGENAAAPAFPTAKPVVPEAKSASTKEGSAAQPKATSREDDLMRRMMGGGSSGSSKAKKASGSDTAKPKWFKG